MGVSPMTHLAGALQTSSLAEGAPPSLGTPSPAVPDCQRRLLLDQLSSSSGKFIVLVREGKEGLGIDGEEGAATLEKDAEGSVAAALAQRLAPDAAMPRSTA